MGGQQQGMPRLPSPTVPKPYFCPSGSPASSGCVMWARTRDTRVASSAFQPWNGGKLPTCSGLRLLACLFLVPRTETQGVIGH